MQKARMGTLSIFDRWAKGAQDESAKRLSLKSEGLKFVGEGTCKYRDTLEIINKDNWLFTSVFQNNEAMGSRSCRVNMFVIEIGASNKSQTSWE